VAERKKTLSPNCRRRRAEWAALFADTTIASEDPAGVKAQALAARGRGLVGNYAASTIPEAEQDVGGQNRTGPTGAAELQHQAGDYRIHQDGDEAGQVARRRCSSFSRGRWPLLEHVSQKDDVAIRWEEGLPSAFRRTTKRKRSCVSPRTDAFTF